MRPTINMLRRAGIGAIVDYAAEDDVGQDENSSSSGGGASPSSEPGSRLNSSAGSTPADVWAPQEVLVRAKQGRAGVVAREGAVGRVFDYGDERMCDRCVEPQLGGDEEI